MSGRRQGDVEARRAAAKAAEQQQEAVEALFLACLKDDMTQAVIERFKAALADLLRDQSVAELEARVGARRGAGGAVASRRSFMDFLEQDAMSLLEKRIMALAPVPGRDGEISRDPHAPRPDVILTAELFDHVRRALRRLGRGGNAEGYRELTANALRLRVLRYGELVREELGRPDPPDLARLVRDLHRVEIIRWIFQVMQCPKEEGSVASQLRSFARMALKRTTEVIEDFLERRDLASRFDAAVVTVTVDDLIVLVTQILDGDREAERAAGDSGFFEAVGKPVIEGFLSAVARFSERTLWEAREQLFEAPTKNAAFRARLGQLEKLFHFCSRIAHERAPAALADMVAAMRRGAIRLANDIAFGVERELKADGGDRKAATGLVEDLGLLHAFAERLGWREEVATINAMFAGRFAAVR